MECYCRPTKKEEEEDYDSNGHQGASVPTQHSLAGVGPGTTYVSCTMSCSVIRTVREVSSGSLNDMMENSFWQWSYMTCVLLLPGHIKFCTVIQRCRGEAY